MILQTRVKTNEKIIEVEENLLDGTIIIYVHQRTKPGHKEVFDFRTAPNYVVGKNLLIVKPEK